MGLMTISAGKIYLNGEDITYLPTHKISRMGVSFVPEDRGILHGLSVHENLKLGMARRKGRQGELMNEVFEIFPVLEERLNQRAGSLSGGEQQMLAMARAWAGNPDLMLVDEFSEGLQPSVIGRIAEAIRGICGKGVAVLLVEQNTKLALSLANRGYILGKGEIVHQGNREELVANDQILKRYLVI
jgi:branched-chain amino acid transport system ATP-binding protein